MGFRTGWYCLSLPALRLCLCVFVFCFVTVLICVGPAWLSPSPSGSCTFARRLLHICPSALAHLPGGSCTFARRLLHICPARGNPHAFNTIYRERLCVAT